MIYISFFKTEILFFLLLLDRRCYFTSSFHAMDRKTATVRLQTRIANTENLCWECLFEQHWSVRCVAGKFISAIFEIFHHFSIYCIIKCANSHSRQIHTFKFALCLNNILTHYEELWIFFQKWKIEFFFLYFPFLPLNK